MNNNLQNLDDNKNLMNEAYKVEDLTSKAGGMITRNLIKQAEEQLSQNNVNTNK